MSWIGIALILLGIISLRTCFKCEKSRNEGFFGALSLWLFCIGLSLIFVSTRAPTNQTADVMSAVELFGPGSDPATWPDHGTEDSR